MVWEKTELRLVRRWFIWATAFIFVGMEMDI